MKALLEMGGRSPGGTWCPWCSAGEAHPTVPGHLADNWPAEPGGRLVAARFRLRSLLGRGGMGRVWLADDELLDRPVAVKQLLLYSLESAEMRARAWAYALREARAAARVEHAGAIRIYDIVQEKGCPWIVMEPLPGRTLQQALNAAGPLPVHQVTRIGLRLVDVLQATHRAGIVHRDVTPGNVHLCGGGRVVLTDFGIACPLDHVSSAPGQFRGTPAYVSPERLDGGDSGPASDLFSLGATLFTAVEGRPAFDRGSLPATLSAVLRDGPAPFLRAGPLRPVIEGLLAKDPGQRLSAGQARAALRAVQRQHDMAQVQRSWSYASPPASAPRLAAARPAGELAPVRVPARLKKRCRYLARLDLRRWRGWISTKMFTIRLANERAAALRRAAVPVAQAAPPGEVFTAVAEEAGRRRRRRHPEPASWPSG